MAGNIIYICGPEKSGKTYMALGLAERLERDFDISHVVFDIENLFSTQEKLLNAKKATTLVIDEPKKSPRPIVSKYKLIDTILHLAANDNNVIITGYPGEEFYDILMGMATDLLAKRQINIVYMGLRSLNAPASYLKMLGISPSKDLLDQYETKFAEAIKT
ncbi:MAG: hypothetical protein QMC77_05560 [Methanocellales archaeon]|nr:hypothetical protein [Methanocellales archaeon]